MSLLIENEVQSTLINLINNIDFNVISLIINYTYPERFLLFIRNVNDLVDYFKYPKSILEVEPSENGVYIVEYFMTNITERQYTLNYRLIQVESIIDNSFHRIDYILFHSEFTNKILSWMIN